MEKTEKINKLIVKDVKYTYEDGQKSNTVLKGVNVEFESGKLYCIIGESGSGKTTLISLISALDSLQEGDIITEVDGDNVTEISILTNYLSKKKPNDKIKLKVYRDRVYIDIELILSENSN